MRVTDAHSRFRDNGTTVAWQKLLRDQVGNTTATGPWKNVCVDLKAASVREVTKKQAERVILTYEWLGTMAPTTYHYGMFFGDVLGGVTCVGGHICIGGNPPFRQFGIDRSRLLFLARGACAHWTPPGSASKLIAWTTRLLERGSVGDVLLAYGDPEAGEIGTVYQACGWSYIGRTGGGHGWESPSMRRVHFKVICNKARNARVPVTEYEKLLDDAGWKPYVISPKYRYAKALNKSVARKIDAMALPYPKRDTRAAADVDGPDLPGQAGGAEPTRPLQE